MSVLVIGSFVMDLVILTNEVPNAGQTVLGLNYNTFPGGKGINQAVSARRLGSEVTMAGAVGNDSNGTIFFDIMNRENIDSSNVIRTSSATGLGNIVLNNQTAENQIIVVPGANHDYNIKDLNKLENAILKANILVAQLELPINVTYEIAKLARKYNKQLILNPAPAVILDDEIYPSITYLTPNETELEILTGIKSNTKKDVIKAAHLLLGKGVKNVIVTLGDKGAIWVNQEFIKEHSGFKVKAVDTVGAGDTFNGALAYGIDQNLDNDKILELANKAASISVTRQGAIPSIPTMAEVSKEDLYE